MKKKLLAAAILVSMVTLSACGGAEKKAENANSDKTAYPMTIKNYGRPEATAEWKEVDQTFDKAPERIVANTRPAAELLLHLGLKDKIVGVGAVFGEPDKEVEKDFDDLHSLGKEYISKEITLGEDPDLVFGRGGLFDNAEWGNGTVNTLNDMGMKTFVLASSVTGGTYESVYEDIENLGNLFGVQENAKTFSTKLKTRQKAIQENLSAIKEEKEFALLFITDPNEVSVYGAKDETFFNDLFKMVKLNNVYAKTEGDISIEALIETDPEVLIIPDWTTTGGVSPEEIKEALYSNAKLSSLKAIKNKQIYAVDYNYMFGYGYIGIEGMELLAKEMYPEQFK